MNNPGLLEHILDRLRDHGEPGALFTADEAADWPPKALDTLDRIGLLRPTPPAKVIECDGCEESCFEEVYIRPAENNRAAHAFIACDKRDDVGRVPVDPKRLEQWRLTGRSLANVLATLLGFTEPQKISSRQNCWMLGTLKGEQYRKQIILAMNRDIVIEVSNHKVPLIDLLKFENGQLVLDQEELHWFSRNPAPVTDSDRRQSCDVKREARKLNKEVLHESWRKEARKLEKAHPNKPQTWIAERISKMDIAESRSQETIRRAIR